VPSNEFRHNHLPSDVKKRYDDYQNPDIIVPVADLVPFLPTELCPTPLKYFHQTDIAGGKVILRNGGVLAATYDSKKFHKTVAYCADVSYHGLRVWYKLFFGHGNACGIYVVPYELLTKGHGGAIGFAFDDDLPAFKSGYGFA
jgi:nitrogen fixation protein